ncbi:MAG: redoxin domain-containing protein [Pseudomonadota bacterium]
MRVTVSGLLLVLFAACAGGKEGGNADVSGVIPDWGWGTLDSAEPPADAAPGEDTPLIPGEDTTVTYPLVPGDTVPDFSLPAHSGAEISLSDSIGKTMVLSFFPTAAQGLSQQQVEKLEARYGEIRALGAFPFGVSMEDPLVLAHWADDLGLLSLLLLSDEGGLVGEMFGLEDDGGHYLHRGDVVIAPDGTLQALLLYDAKEPTDIQALLSILEQ